MKRKLRDGQDVYTMDTSVLLAQPMFERVLIYFLGVILLLALGFTYLTQYTRVESARGEITAASGFSTIAAENGAVIAELIAKPGAVVRKGDPLARLSRPKIISEGSDPFAVSVAQMREALLNFDQRVADNALAIAATRQQIDAVRRGANISRAAAAERRSLTASRRAVAVKRLTAIEELAGEGMVSGMAVDQARVQSLQLMQEAADAELQLNELARGRDERVAILEAQARELSQSTLALKTERLATQKQLNDLLAGQSFTVVAPVEGIVAAVAVRSGQRVEAGQRMFAIAQPSAKLAAVLEVPSRAIGLIEEGQRVSLKYDAFPYQSYGLRFGTVTRVEVASIEVGDGLATKEGPSDRSFLVEVVPHDSSVTAFGRPRPLRVGMMLTADIEVEQRSLLSWWLSPLLTLKGRLQ